MGEFEGRQVVVTGGTGGLGRAVVSGLLARGATCHVPCYDSRELAGHALWDHERVHVTEGVDLTDEAATTKFFAPLDGLFASVHLAGGFAMAPIADTRAADLERMFRLNALTCFLASREAVGAMRRGGSAGRIVNVAARPGLSPVGGMLAYTTSKAAVVALTKAMAAELIDDGILVNAVAPSIMDTPQNRAAMPDADFDAWPKVEQVASAITYLASTGNTLTTGFVMPVYGRA